MTSAQASATRADAASVGSGDGPPGGSQPWLRRAMALVPSLRVFIAAGMYDSLNGCDDNDYLVAHVEPEFARRMSTGCYGGGHMMYDTKDARFALKRDIAAFVKNRRSEAQKKRDGSSRYVERATQAERASDLLFF